MINFLLGLLVGESLVGNPSVLDDGPFWLCVLLILSLILGLYVIWTLCELVFVKWAGRERWDDDVARSRTWIVFFFFYCPLWVFGAHKAIHYFL